MKLKGRNYKLYFGKNGKRKLDVTDQLKKNASFRIEVNLSRNMVMIYARDGNKGYIIPVKAMICSAGMPGHRTITGNYPRLRRAGRWQKLRYSSVGQYCTRVSLYYNKKAKYPLARPKAKKIGRTSSKRYYDPTDPKAAAHHKVE